MAFRSKIVAAAVGFTLCAAGLGGAALAEDAAPMAGDHMSSDHMSGAMKKPAMKHKAKHHMTHGGAMSSDHMAPDASKQ